jgi:hypothetical protein
MQEITHKEERIAENITYRLQDIYVKDRDEAMSVDTSLLIQGSKLLIVEAMELYVLNQDGGEWYRVPDLAVLK